MGRLGFSWHYHNDRFAQALAALGSEPGPDRVRSSRELWACHRLGLHATVARSARADGHWRGAFASAVAFAACGRPEEAEAAAREIQKSPNRGRRVRLATALAAFRPELSLELIEGMPSPPTPPTLRVALLRRTGQEERAGEVLADALARGEERRYPELWLHASNGEKGSPREKLARLNAYLGSYGLLPLGLRDGSKPPSPTNVCVKEAVSKVDGPLVTVIMTTYQTRDRVGAAMDSVLGQSHGNLELIVVDDGSTDGTREVVEPFLRRDGRVRYLRLESNGGTYVARNAGLMLARGEYVTCHDSDDWSHPWKLERQLRPLLADGNVVCSTSSWVRIQDDGEYYARPVHPLTRMNPSSPMFRRALLSRVGVWDAVRTGADTEFLARMGLHVGARGMCRVKEPLTLGSHRGGSLMTSGETGYSPEGISPARLAYWEAWTWWHISELRAGRRPVTGRGKGRIVGVPFGEVEER